MRCLRPFMRLLLEHVKHVDRLREADGIDGSIGIPVVIFDDLEDPRTSESLQRLRMRMVFPELRSPQRESDRSLNGLREQLEVTSAASSSATAPSPIPPTRPGRSVASRTRATAATSRRSRRASNSRRTTSTASVTTSRSGNPSRGRSEKSSRSSRCRRRGRTRAFCKNAKRTRPGIRSTPADVGSSPAATRGIGSRGRRRDPGCPGERICRTSS